MNLVNDMAENKDSEWKKRLSPLAYRVTRKGATERPFTGEYYLEKRNGNYHCVCCDHILFTSEMKYDSGCGWPAFHTEHEDAGIKRIEDFSHGMRRVEVVCGKCDAHLGHVFQDGPNEHGGERYCINSVCLNFILEEVE